MRKIKAIFTAYVERLLDDPMHFLIPLFLGLYVFIAFYHWDYEKGYAHNESAIFPISSMPMFSRLPHTSLRTRLDSIKKELGIPEGE